MNKLVCILLVWTFGCLPLQKKTRKKPKDETNSNSKNVERVVEYHPPTPRETPKNYEVPRSTSSIGPSTSVSYIPLMSITQEKKFQQLPYQALQQKIVSVLGIPLAHTSFHELDKFRYELGDYDFGIGVAEQRTWTIRKQGQWLRGVEVLCQEWETLNPQYAARSSILQWIEDAYGRSLQANDRAVVDRIFDESHEHFLREVCVTVLNSLEFILEK